MKDVASILVSKSDKSVTFHCLPGFVVKSEKPERKGPIESWRKERNSSFFLFSLLLTVIMDKQII